MNAKVEQNQTQGDLQEKLVQVNRVAKVVKGGVDFERGRRVEDFRARD